jgi:hypothetical protein
MLLGIGKKNLHIVGSSCLFHGYYWLDPWRNIKEYTLCYHTGFEGVFFPQERTPWQKNDMKWAKTHSS